MDFIAEHEFETLWTSSAENIRAIFILQYWNKEDDSDDTEDEDVFR